MTSRYEKAEERLRKAVLEDNMELVGRILYNQFGYTDEQIKKQYDSHTFHLAQRYRAEHKIGSDTRKQYRLPKRSYYDPVMPMYRNEYEDWIRRFCKLNHEKLPKGLAKMKTMELRRTRNKILKRVRNNRSR
jgi:hypothetical protein